MTSFRLRSLFAVVTLSMAACLDLSPSVVVKAVDDAAPGTSEECYKCLTGPSGPTAGCAEQLADCEKLPLCQRGVDCTFHRGCYDIDVPEEAAICIRYCADLVGFMTVDSPETKSALLWHNCAITKCQSECRGSDAGPPDAGADVSVSDGGVVEDAPSDVRGTACQNPDDQAVQMGAAFGSAARDCGFMCFGSTDPTCTAACMRSKGLSEACSACWGETIKCGTKYCIAECLEQTSPGCLACNAMYCDPAFRTCSGNN